MASAYDRNNKFLENDGVLGVWKASSRRDIWILKRPHYSGATAVTLTQGQAAANL